MDAEKSKLKKKGAFQFKQDTTKALATNKPLPVEALINELQLPPMVNGTRHIFDSGVEYAVESIDAATANLVTLGLRRRSAIEVSRQGYREW